MVLTDLKMFEDADLKKKKKKKKKKNFTKTFNRPNFKSFGKLLHSHNQPYKHIIHIHLHMHAESWRAT